MRIAGDATYVSRCPYLYDNTKFYGRGIWYETCRTSNLNAIFIFIQAVGCVAKKRTNRWGSFLWDSHNNTRIGGTRFFGIAKTYS